jgi:hypothetical protein
MISTFMSEGPFFDALQLVQNPLTLFGRGAQSFSQVRLPLRLRTRAAAADSANRMGRGISQIQHTGERVAGTAGLVVIRDRIADYLRQTPRAKHRRAYRSMMKTQHFDFRLPHGHMPAA